MTTLDIAGDGPRDGAVGHVRADVRRLGVAALQGFDAILCCETLEHLQFAEVPAALAAFHATSAPHLVLSAPYQGPQLGVSLYANFHRWPRFKYFHRVHFLRHFRPSSSDDWDHHRWEIDYRGFPLKKLTRIVESAGYRVVRREFTGGTRSVFLVCEREPQRRV
ncbi:MAG: class I SAM-dependent methyltransferase [Alphaproteobacteria bacterium]|nr:class I SAM-dependent methyltransferase [Alphaproteobacteria bacterium]